MANLVLNIPDGENCVSCDYRVRNTEADIETYHCKIFGSRADSHKTRECMEQSQKESCGNCERLS